MTGQPSISVILPVYNGAKYLSMAIESVLTQTHADFELLIIDDGSTDETPEVLDRCQDARITRLHNASSLGIASCANRALEISRGEWIARMDADDICLPQRFERQVSYLDAHPQVGVLGSAFWFIDPQGHRLGERPVCWGKYPLMVRWLLYCGNPLVHSTVMMRRDILQKVGGYNPALRRSQDYDLWCRLNPHCEITNLPEALLQYRTHNPEQVSFADRDNQLASGCQIRQDHIAALTGQRLPPAVIMRLSEHDTSAAPRVERAACAALLMIYGAFARRWVTTGSPEAVGVQREMMERLYAISWKRRVSPLLWQYLVYSAGFKAKHRLFPARGS